jgi:hypothetical protein
MYVGLASIIAGSMGSAVVVFDNPAEDGDAVEDATEAIDAIESSTRALISVGDPITGGDFGVDSFMLGDNVGVSIVDDDKELAGVVVDEDVLLVLVGSIVGFSIGVFMSELSMLFPFPFPIIQPAQ